MSLQLEAMRQTTALAGRGVFLSASIPDPTRWKGDFEAMEITDAVAAAARAILTASGTIVTAAHPTIAPLLLYVAGEFQVLEGVVIYQSHLFDRILPEATRRFETAGTGRVRWTDAMDGDAPEPGRWDASLRLMRETMFSEAEPVAAIFIGGMQGIPDEYELFGTSLPERPRYALGRPGGAARELANADRSPLGQDLATGDVYPALFRRVVNEISGSQLNAGT